MTYTIVLAFISFFLCLRLFALFGRKRNATSRASYQSCGANTRCAAAAPAVKEVEVHSDKVTDPMVIIKMFDKSFDLGTFLSGAKDIYKLILTAYAKGDTQALSTWLNIDMMRKFAYAITQREDKDLHCEIDVISVKDAVLDNATCEKDGLAQLRVTFTAEVINYVTSKTNKVVEGNKTKVENKQDVWTFSKNLRYTGQSWKLTEVSQLF